MAFVRCTQREMNTDHQILSEWGIAMNSGSRVVGTSRVTKILSCGKDGGWYMFGGSKYLCYTTLHYITLPYTVEWALSSLRRRRACSKYCCNQSGSDYGWTINLLPGMRNCAWQIDNCGPCDRIVAGWGTTASGEESLFLLSRHWLVATQTVHIDIDIREEYLARLPADWPSYGQHSYLAEWSTRIVGHHILWDPSIDSAVFRRLSGQFLFAYREAIPEHTCGQLL